MMSELELPGYLFDELHVVLRMGEWETKEKLKLIFIGSRIKSDIGPCPV